MKRTEKKRQTREAIIEAALRLSEEKNVAGMSLREVARAAGITPAAFYRHFEDMDELRLHLIDQVGDILRQLMRQARQRISQQGSAINTSIDVFMEFLDDNPHLLRLLAGERAGGPVVFREALHREKQRFIEELIDDLTVDIKTETRPLAYIPEAADLMVNLVLGSGLDALDLEPAAREKLIQQLKLQLRMIVTGAHGLYLLEQQSQAKSGGI